MAVNRAVSSHPGRVGLTRPARRTRWSYGRAGDTTAPHGGEVHPGRVRPVAGRGYEPAIPWGGGSRDCRPQHHLAHDQTQTTMALDEECGLAGTHLVRFEAARPMCNNAQLRFLDI